MALDTRLLEILACPEDKGPLYYFEDEAESVADPEHERLMAKVASAGLAPTFAE